MAATAAAADFNGSYSWSGAAEDRTSISQAVEQAASHVPAFIRPLVRNRLTRVVVPYHSIDLGVTNDVVTFNRNASDQPIRARIGGRPISYAPPDGKMFEVTFAAEGENLRQTYSNNEGTRENLFSLSEDGAILTMAVTIRPAIIKSAISLTLTYVKTNQVDRL